MSSSISPKDQKILWGRSSGRCAFKSCRKNLIHNKTEKDSESLIGEMAHIKGEKQTAARYDSQLGLSACNEYENLILLCRDHHKLVDDQYNEYTVEKLYEMKKEHESWVDECLKGEITNVTFAELEVITKYLNSNQPQTPESFVVITPKDKIKKNQLSAGTEALITMGITQATQVRNYISNCIDSDFGERLKNEFVIKYLQLKNDENLSGDELFYGLLDFASQGFTEFKEKAAGLAVLVYFFEACDIFEK